MASVICDPILDLSNPKDSLPTLPTSDLAFDVDAGW